jgi:hypothetical protein
VLLGPLQAQRNGKKLCKPAENQGACTVEENACIAGSLIYGTARGGGCVCYVTRSGRSFCGNDFPIQSGNCDCASNKACERRIGMGAKCVQVSEPCASSCPLGVTSACMAACPTLDS